MAKRPRRTGSNIFDVSDSLNVKIAPQHIDNFDIQDGYEDDEGADRSDNFAGMEDDAGNVVVIEFPDSMWIDPREYRERAKQNDEYRLWATNTREDIGRFLNQSPTSMCTTFAKAYNAENAYRRQFGLDIRDGRRGNIFLAPNSLYGISNPSGRGGANCLNITRIAIENGFLPSTYGDQEAIFGDHCIADTHGRGGVETSIGRFISQRSFPSGSSATAKKLRPTKVINPRTIEQVICLLLHGLIVDVGRSGHAIGYGGLGWSGSGDMPDVFLYDDSYDVTRADSFRTARGCVGTSTAILNMTDPPQAWIDWFYGVSA